MLNDGKTPAKSRGLAGLIGEDDEQPAAAAPAPTVAAPAPRPPPRRSQAGPGAGTEDGGLARLEGWARLEGGARPRGIPTAAGGIPVAARPKVKSRGMGRCGRAGGQPSWLGPTAVGGAEAGAEARAGGSADVLVAVE